MLWYGLVCIKWTQFGNVTKLWANGCVDIFCIFEIPLSLSPSLVMLAKYPPEDHQLQMNEVAEIPPSSSRIIDIDHRGKREILFCACSPMVVTNRSLFPFYFFLQKSELPPLNRIDNKFEKLPLTLESNGQDDVNSESDEITCPEGQKHPSRGAPPTPPTHRTRSGVS